MPAAAPAEPLPAPFAPSGRLRLEVEPAGLLQVFVDDVYVRMPGDTGGEIDLAPGVRRVELRAVGYRALTIGVRVVAERTVTYRSALTPETPEPATQTGDGAADMLPAVAPMGSRTIDVIPGCYLGNVPPQDAKLPAGCGMTLRERLIERAGRTRLAPAVRKVVLARILRDFIWRRTGGVR